MSKSKEEKKPELPRESKALLAARAKLIAEEKKINAEANALFRKCHPLNEKAAQLAADAIVSSGWLGATEWTFAAWGTDQCILTARTLPKEFDEIEKIMSDGWNHYSRSLGCDVELRVDDSEFKLIFPDPHSLRAFASTHKLKVDFSKLEDKVVKARAEYNKWNMMMRATRTWGNG